MSQLGFQINTHKHTASPALVRKFAAFAVANISDSMSRTNGTTNLRPFHKGGRILGRAFTVKTAPGDNLLVHAALNMAAPGDVIVVDAGGESRNAIIGEIMSAVAVMRKLGGMIIDGPIRDVQAIGQGKFPVFARSISHRGPYKEGPGELNVTVAIDGMVVHPGDIIVGDYDGLLAIRPDVAADLAKEVAAVEKKEKDMLAKIANGTIDRSWVEAALRAKGALK